MLHQQVTEPGEGLQATRIHSQQGPLRDLDVRYPYTTSMYIITLATLGQYSHNKCSFIIEILKVITYDHFTCMDRVTVKSLVAAPCFLVQ